MGNGLVASIAIVRALQHRLTSAITECFGFIAYLTYEYMCSTCTALSLQYLSTREHRTGNRSTGVFVANILCDLEKSTAATGRLQVVLEYNVPRTLYIQN